MRLRDKLRQDMRIRNHSERTIGQYISLVGKFFEWLGKPPGKATRDDVRDFLLYMINDLGVVAGTYGQYRTALKFFFEITMGKPCVIERILTPKRPKALPDVMSLDEVLALLECVQSYRNRVTLTAMYGAGLRITEACALCVGDIDSQRMVIHVRNGKGRKDRYVMLPQMVLSLLRRYWRMSGLQERDDVRAHGQAEGPPLPRHEARQAHHAAEYPPPRSTRPEGAPASPAAITRTRCGTASPRTSSTPALILRWCRPCWATRASARPASTRARAPSASAR